MWREKHRGRRGHREPQRVPSRLFRKDCKKPKATPPLSSYFPTTILSRRHGGTEKDKYRKLVWAVPPCLRASVRFFCLHLQTNKDRSYFRQPNNHLAETQRKTCELAVSPRAIGCLDFWSLLFLRVSAFSARKVVGCFFCVTVSICHEITSQ